MSREFKAGWAGREAGGRLGEKVEAGSSRGATSQVGREAAWSERNHSNS